MRQLPLDLALPPRFGRADYVVSSTNAAALHVMEQWPHWPDRVQVLIGPPGSGKSHLAAIWAARAAAAVLPSTAVLDPTAPGSFVGRALLIDDAERFGRQEAALFHLLNRVREEGAFLLLTAGQAPDAWGLTTADLLSRLRLAPAVTLQAPDDDLLRSVLVKLFADRQLVVDAAVIAYLVLRLDRSIAAARAAVDALDRAGLALNRRVTRPMAAALLGERDHDTEEEDA